MKKAIASLVASIVASIVESIDEFEKDFANIDEEKVAYYASRSRRRAFDEALEIE